MNCVKCGKELEENEKELCKDCMKKEKKAKKEKKENPKTENEVKETDIKTLVRDALEELVGDKYIIMKGSSDVSVVNQGYVPNVGSVPVINQSSINKAISNQDASENKSLLAGMLDDMDDDDDL